MSGAISDGWCSVERDVLRVYSCRHGTADVPGHCTFSVFLSGCSGGCSYCFSKELWDRRSGCRQWNHVRERLWVNRWFTEYVCFTGGDALAQPLEAYAIALKEAGFKVAVHATPIHPSRLERMVGAGMVDNVHLSLYTTDAKPHMRDRTLASRSVVALRDSGVDYTLNVTTTRRTEHEVPELREFVATLTDVPLGTTRALRPELMT